LCARAGDKIEYNRDIRPILAENCFPCHGPDSAARKAGLRLDRRQDAIDAGAIIPGKPEDSELCSRVVSEDAKLRMPPAKLNKKLTPAQKNVLRQWIVGGAAYQPHWSLIAPRRAELPQVKNTGWARNAIDRFILAGLENAGLQPAREADRRTLARRLSLDLTGLPPEPELVDAFVRDASPAAYEDLVDRLLRSPRWGEHRGRYWLDAARYADTHGIHIDNYREIYTYRDWVIKAFNRNLPFDQFTLEQLAGDLLPGATMEQRIASGFNRCNITTNEGGAIAEEYLVFYTRDRTETTSQVWMGLTAGCAVCHDHKFDALSQREFYQMAAFFNNTTQAAMDGNIKDTPPIIVVPRTEDLARWQATEREIKQLEQDLTARRNSARPLLDRWVDSAYAREVAGRIPKGGLCFYAPLNEGEGKTVAVWMGDKQGTSALSGDAGWGNGHVAAKALKAKKGSTLKSANAGDFERSQAFSAGAWILAPRRNLTGAVLARMDDKKDYRGWDLSLEGNKPATHIVHKWPDDALKVVATKPLKEGTWNHVFISYDGSGKASGVKIYVNGELQGSAIAADALKNTIRTEAPFTVAQRATASHLDDLLIQDLRVYDHALSKNEVAGIAHGTRIALLAAKPVEKRNASETGELLDWWLADAAPGFRVLLDRKSQIDKERAGIKSQGTIAHVMNERSEAPKAFTLFRGEYDKRRDQVSAQTPAALPPMPANLPRNRLGFARWLLLPDHPLTARVTVNRFWQEVFGIGLVRTAGDFGVSGELPSHPELLDWLAVEFRESGWDIKRLFKLMVMSSTYRQAALVDAAKLDRDPQNRLLSRGPRFRMDGEMIRDYVLATSGLLVEKLGGPSVKPYQPDGVWEAVAMIGSDTRDYKRDSGDRLYRRSMYTFWKRSAPPASMEVFNAPSRETCTVKRERTDTPLQALVTLNDPQFVEAARQLAQRTWLKGGKTAEERIDYLARRVLSRSFSVEEKALVRQSLDDLLGYYESHADDAKKLLAVGDSPVDASIPQPELAAWTMLGNQILNLDEVLNK
jgi:hypothetical protein